MTRPLRPFTLDRTRGKNYVGHELGWAATLLLIVRGSRPSSPSPLAAAPSDKSLNLSRTSTWQRSSLARYEECGFHWSDGRVREIQVMRGQNITANAVLVWI